MSCNNGNAWYRHYALKHSEIGITLVVSFNLCECCQGCCCRPEGAADQVEDCDCYGASCSRGRAMQFDIKPD